MKKKKTTQHIKKNKSEEMHFKQTAGKLVQDPEPLADWLKVHFPKHYAKPEVDPINPPHYNEEGLIPPIDVIEDWNLGFCLGNCIKYIARAGKKNKDTYIEDLKKALWYLEREIGKKR